MISLLTALNLTLGVWLLLRGIVLTNLSDQWRRPPGHTARNISVKIFAAFCPLLWPHAGAAADG